MHHAYGFHPCYLSLIHAGKIEALLPLMEIRSSLTGRRGVGLPFTDYCPPIGQSREQLDGMAYQAIQLARQRNWRRIDLRCGLLPRQAKPFCHFYRHTLSLSGTIEKTRRRLRNSTLRNVRRAQNSGLAVHIRNSLEAMKQYYHLHGMTRKRLGVPPQPWYFFQAVYDRIIAKQKGHVIIASLAKEPVAAAIFFHFAGHAIFKYGASDSRFNRHRPNNLIMWEAIRHYTAMGCKTLDFGRTAPNNFGLRQFKNGWGCVEDIVTYTSFDVVRNRYRSKSSTHGNVFNLLKRLPNPLFRLVGYALYRHIG